MIEPMIFARAVINPGGRHRCGDTGGSHVALQGEPRGDEGSGFHLHKKNPVLSSAEQ
jgi:hypothetical protein